MFSKKYWIVAKFEFKEVVRKPSFWLATLFMPLFLGVVSFVSGYSSVESAEAFEKGYGNYQKVYILDQANIINDAFIAEPLIEVYDYDTVIEDVKQDAKAMLIVIPEDFSESFQYELIYKKDEAILAGLTMPSVINNLLKQSALTEVQDPVKAKLLSVSPATIVQTVDDEGNMQKETIGQYIVPIISFVVFFLAVFIASGYLLQSVSAEKENRMIETMLSIVDKKSLMFGKMLGLGGVIILQLLVWLFLGLGIFLLVQQFFSLSLPIEIGELDVSTIPVNLFLILSAFVFFGAIMTGVGAIGTGAQDSKNLSSVFIILAIFPVYVMQVLITNPTGTLSQIFTYFPFTSHLILLFRNSLGAITTAELIIGLIVTTVYSIIALVIALKLFELGCLMYNRRPTVREIIYHLKR